MNNLKSADSVHNIPPRASRVAVSMAFPEETNSLHVELAGKITRLIHDQALDPGARLYEKRLADQLGVSRTPVRAALEHLAHQGFIERRENRGVELVKRPPLPVVQFDSIAPGDALLARIAADRRSGQIADQVSEQEVMLAYGLTRAAVKQVLSRLADLGLVERKLGYRWKFIDQSYNAKAQAESFRFRLVVEPAALLEPEFSLPPGWLDNMIERHQGFIGRRWTEASSVAFFEMNAAFHEGLAAGAGNRFFVESLHRVNQRRRLANYDWRHGRDRVDVSCDEHLAVLHAVKAGDMKQAAERMRVHLSGARLARTVEGVRED
jgi:DNA-binding GntR family transcriptional regulator